MAPAHVGIPGNELADSLAKAGALGLPGARESITQLDERDFLRTIKTQCLQEWKSDAAHDWYRAGGTSTGSVLPREQQSLISRLKSGHLRTMTFQNGCKVFPLCTKCNSQPATPRHIIDCIDSSIDELYSSPADTIKNLKLYKLDTLVKSNVLYLPMQDNAGKVTQCWVLNHQIFRPNSSAIGLNTLPITRRSRRLQGLQPELSTVLAFPARKKMEREENRPFCHRWRDPTVFSGERGEDSQRWLSDFQRVARYNKWDDSMCLANVIFYLTGTAKCWFENFEEILNSWEEFKIKFCEIFGNKEDTARKAENILRTRAQTSGENVESYIQEVLLLCKQSNPRMSEGEKTSHLIKGVAEEVYQALFGKDIGTVDQFVAFCRRFEAFKRMRVAPPRFSRLPNVTTISTAEPENLEALIRRIVREEVQKFIAPPSTFTAQDIDTPPPDLRDVIRSEIQQTLAPISAPRQPESFRPRRQYLPQNDQVYRRRTEGPPNNQRTQWRTEDDRPICFHCGRPGHVARYCRDRRQAFADARLGRETVDFGRPRTENYTMGESGSELSQGRFRNPSPYPHRGRFQAPRRTSQSPARRPSRSPSRRTATMEKNWISVNIQGRNVQALVDSGADYSIISEAFRRSIKAPVFKENGPLLRAADKKPIVTLGKCSLEVRIKGLDIIFDFVVAAECSHDVILGWDFFKATDAIIDCGENKLYLSEAEKSYEWKDLKLCAAMDCVIPPKSFGKIVVTNQDVFGSRDVVVTGSKRLQLEKGLFIPSSLVRFLHGRAVLWVTNSTHQSQVIPSDMKIGTMQDLEVGSISNLDACSEIAGKDEVTSPDVRECLISMISTDLEETKKNRLLTCLNEFSDIFDFEKKSFPVSGEIKHKIDTSDYPPVRQRPYRVSPAERRVIQSEVEKMMETKIIRPSSSPWASPVILVRKKDGSLRFCVDYRRLNKITKKDVYPLPRIDDALDTLSGSRYFSTMDMRSGYWQIEVDDKDREKTAFITPDGLYEFNVMPFGLCNAPATFERMIDNVLRGLKWDMCLCYLDDIVVYGSTFKEHLTRLYKVLRCIQQAGLCLNYKKCHFASRQITILGHVVNEFGTQPDPEKGEEQDESFRILKQELGSSPVLGHFIEGAETHVHTDASGYGLGAVLVQIQNDAERPIAYASRTLTKAEKNYSTTEKECLAVVWALGIFRPYLYGRPFTVVTDHHSLCWLVGLKDPSCRLARWALKLQEYDINIVYKSGRKHKDADCLSRSPLADTAEIEGHITSIQDIAEEQSKDPHLVGIREKLANENLKGYQMIGGVLYKKNYDPEGKPWLLVVPKQMRHEILKDVHDTPMAGHLGFAKTYDRVRKRFYWPGLYRTVSQYIPHCKECQRRKGVPQKPPGLLVPIPPTTSPFQKIGIDYLGRFPISHTGNRWIIVATDYLTRFAITKAAATAEATELATFLIEDVILKHGAPREIITDRGRNFMSQTIREINNLNGTIHRFTTAYHPQTNGLTERLNKTLTDMISMYVDVDQKNWDNILPYVTFAYNTARQETTGFSPFFLVHGREVETPLDFILPCQPAGTAEDYVGHLVTNAEDARMLARLNILQAQSKEKERYDKKHQEVTYKEGDLVWVFTPVRTVGLSEKLLKRYFGPYRVIRKISSVNYQVEGVKNTRRRRKTQDIVHVVRMKPYHDPEVQEQIAQ
ncbi:K02A2.6-like, partial [Cordylochernes scorpioides]